MFINLYLGISSFKWKLSYLHLCYVICWTHTCLVGFLSFYYLFTYLFIFSSCMVFLTLIIWLFRLQDPFFLFLPCFLIATLLDIPHFAMELAVTKLISLFQLGFNFDSTFKLICFCFPLILFNLHHFIFLKGMLYHKRSKNVTVLITFILRVHVNIVYQQRNFKYIYKKFLSLSSFS